MNIAFSLLLAVVAGVFGIGHAPPAQASVVIAGTRLVYPEDESEVTVRLSNAGKLPALTQAWIDNGQAGAAPSDVEVPFTVAPPVTRIDPGKGQTLRVFYTGASLPEDHESVFWLNVLEMPPKPTGKQADANKLMLAFRTRIKVFFRPAGLPGRADDAPSRLHWRLTEEDGHPAIEASNPTPYHVSLAALEYVADGHATRARDGDMVKPGETRTFALEAAVTPVANARIRYHAISDYGGFIDGESRLDALPSMDYAHAHAATLGAGVAQLPHTVMP